MSVDRFLIAKNISYSRVLFYKGDPSESPECLWHVFHNFCHGKVIFTFSLNHLANEVSGFCFLYPRWSFKLIPIQIGDITITKTVSKE